MTGNLVEERDGAETIADVIDVLCAKRAEWERIANGYWERVQTAERERDSLDDDCRRLRTSLVAEQRRVSQLTVANKRGDDVLARYDRLTLDLWLYLVELAGHRDTAKTKAERVALGHVVERLKQIRGVNDAEAEALK